MKRVLGIDFGTTNSSVAIFPPVTPGAGEDRAELLGPYAYQNPYECLLPTRALLRHRASTLVLFTEADEKEAAGSLALRNFKPFLNERHLRRVSYTTVREIDVTAPPSAVDGSQVFKQRTIPHLERAGCDREQLMEATTAVLKELLIQPGVRRHWDDVVRIAIGVPAAYGIVARHRLLECLYRTHLFKTRLEVVKCVTFVPEPVAISIGAPSTGTSGASSSLATPFAPFQPNSPTPFDSFDPFADSACGLDDRKVRKVLVFDFGGGTLDLALVYATTDALGHLVPSEVLAVGAPQADVGGRHFDDWIYDYVVRREGQPARAKSELMPLIEEAKIRLSTELEDQLFWLGKNISLTRAEVDCAIEPLLVKTFTAVDQFMAANDIDPAAIDAVLPAGGMCLMPAVFSKLVQRFGANRVVQWGPRILRDDRASQRILAATSIGAAMYAYAMEESQSSMDVQRLTEVFVWDFDDALHAPDRLKDVALARSSTKPGVRTAEANVCLRRSSDGAGPGVVAVIIRTGANDLPLQWTGEHIGIVPAGQRAVVRVELEVGKPWPCVSFALDSAPRDFTPLKSIDMLDEMALKNLLKSETIAIGERAGSRPICWDPIQVKVDQVVVRHDLRGPRHARILNATTLADDKQALVLWPREIRGCRIKYGDDDSESGNVTIGPDEVEVL